MNSREELIEHDIEPWSPTGRIDSPVSCKKCDRSLFIGADGGWQHVRRSEPQGEPSDAQVLAALNAWNVINPGEVLSDYADSNVSHMRAALRAAGQARGA